MKTDTNTTAGSDCSAAYCSALVEILGETTDLYLCGNSHVNGMFQGDVCSLGVGGLEFGTNVFPSPKLEVAKDVLTMSGQCLPFSSESEWVGNWCWNSYRVMTKDVAKLLLSERFRSDYSPEGGDEDIWEWWERFTQNFIAHSQEGRKRGPDNQKD